VFTARYDLSIKKLELPASRRWEFRDFAKEVNQTLLEFTQFAAPGESADAILGASRADDLLLQARTALQTNNARRAVQLLQDAVKADPNNKQAWTIVAELQFTMQLNEDALASMRKVVELDAGNVGVYEFLAQRATALGKYDEAIEAYRLALKTDANCFDCHKNLGDLLLEKKLYSDALAEFVDADARKPGTSQVRNGLALAYLGEGKNDKAFDEFKKSAEDDHSPFNLNEVAWDMADAGQHLPEALNYARWAVKTVETDSSDVNLDELDIPDLRRMGSLASYWDTLGWVYFKKEDLGTAVKYIAAAWNLSQSPVVGLHLAQLYEKQGKQTEAIHVCAMAKAAKETPAEDKELREYFEKLVPDKTKREALVRTAAGDVSQMRLFHIPPPPGTKTGSAEFFVLLVPGVKVEEVKFISGEDALRPLAKQIAAARYSIPFPDDSEAKLVRRGILMCSGTAIRCDFVLIPPDSVVSTH
jgi:tetratricopeptide (TPR) repeat protein